jgi:hypothetical protein
MSNSCPLKRIAVAAALSLSFAGCQQSDQQLPFQIAPGEGATVQIGPAGGVVSLPPSFSLEIPANALTSPTSVDVAQLISGPFPADAGVPVPGSAYEVGPVGTTLAAPAVVRIKVDPALVAAGSETLLSVAVRRGDGSVRTYGGTFDLTNSMLVAEVDELGAMAAVVARDAIAVLAGLPDSLTGGSFPLPPAPAPAPVGAAAAPSYGGVVFTASCSPSERQCFSSGLIRVWADDVVTDRLGDDLFLVDGSVDVDLEFFDFDGSGVPTSAVGTLTVTGDLRARFNSTIATYELAESSTTGSTTDPVPTSLRFESGNVMVFGLTTSISGDIIEPNFDDAANFGVDGIGTSEMLILRVETELEFENSDGTFEYGLIVAYLRLRR